MPTYDYQCRSCGSVTEVIHSMRDEGPTACDVCGGELRRVLYPAGIIFKGSGFYRTDSRATPAGSSSESKSSSEAGASPGSPKSGSNGATGASDSSGSPKSPSSSTGSDTATPKKDSPAA